MSVSLFMKKIDLLFCIGLEEMRYFFLIVFFRPMSCLLISFLIHDFHILSFKIQYIHQKESLQSKQIRTFLSLKPIPKRNKTHDR